MPTLLGLFSRICTCLLTTLTGKRNLLAMKVKPAKQYKRKLSKAALDAMSAGGRNGSVKDKRKAGKAGWQALRKAWQTRIKNARKDQREWNRVERDIAKIK